MIKIIRSNQKAFLAVLSIGAMISLVVNFGGKGRGDGNTFNDHAIGTIGKKTVNLSEVVQARSEVDALKRYISFAPAGLLEREKPELFMLLRHDANDLGYTVSETEVTKFLDDHRIPTTVEIDSDTAALIHDAVADMLKIFARFQTLRQTMKVSQPRVDLMMAEEAEALQVKLVQLRAEDYLDKVPAPTPEQMKAQFDQFANTFARHPMPTTNPFGFGYKIPQRASFGYIKLTDEAITAAVVASKAPYDWEVLAHKYYYTNLATEFMQPAETAEGPAVPGVTAPATRPAVPKPYEKVRDEILTTLRKDSIAALKDQVEAYITNTMTTDWKAYSAFIAANPKGGTEPASSLGRPYSSLDYLVSLCGAVHEKFNVNIAADKTPDALSQEQYSTWPGVGSPEVTQFVDKQSSDYLALLAKNDPTAPAVLIQPSAALQGSVDSQQLFVRLTGATAAQAPADLSSVRAQVDSDLRLAAAYKIAQSQAAALLIAANDNNLETAAKTAGHPILESDPPPTIYRYGANLKTLVPPLGDDTEAFLKEGFSLLAKYQPSKNPHPAVTIELPASKRVFVVQLNSVEAMWHESTYFQTRIAARNQLISPAEQALVTSWFSLEDATKRMDYKQSKGN